MKILHYVLLLFLFAFNANSQTLSGTVYDENQQTIPGASVYLDGTSIGTTTDENGKYELNVRSKINTILVISFIGYEPQIIEKPFETPRLKVYLTSKVTTLKEVTIQADGFSRKEKLRVFREQFLGRTKSGRSCIILNEDDISFQYNLKTNTLTATSEVPLVIQNSYLGYGMSFHLVDFYVEFNRKTLASESAVSSYFAGTVVYKELTSNNAPFAAKRKKVYLGSQVQFFRNMAARKWGKDVFELYNGSLPASPDDYFEITSEGGVYKVTVKPNAQFKSQLQLEKPQFYSSFNLMFDRKDQSKVVFKTETFNIDEFGNTNAPSLIIFGGEMSKYRVGDLLPLDFPG